MDSVTEGDKTARKKKTKEKSKTGERKSIGTPQEESRWPKRTALAHGFYEGPANTGERVLLPKRDGVAQNTKCLKDKRGEGVKRAGRKGKEVRPLAQGEGAGRRV